MLFKSKVFATSVLFIFSLSTQLFAGKKDSDYDSEKLVLVQYLFSCQSIVENTIDLDPSAKQLKFFYLGLGSDYVVMGQEALDKLKGLNEEIDKKLIKNVDNLLQTYNTFFTDSSNLSKEEVTSSLHDDLVILEKVIQELYESKK